MIYIFYVEDRLPPVALSGAYRKISLTQFKTSSLLNFLSFIAAPEI